MNSKQLRNILSEVKNERRGGAPHELWVKRNRDILMMQVRNTTDSATRTTQAEQLRRFFSIFFPAEQFALAARGIGVFALVVGTLFGGGLVSAQAFRNAAPGQMMYPVKLTVESVQLFLAPNEDYRARLHTEFADRRADEIAGLAEAAVINEKDAAAALASFSREAQALRRGLERMQKEDPALVIEAAKLMERKAAVYRDVLRKASGILPSSLHSALAEAGNLVDGVTLAAMTVIVEKHLAGDVNAPRTVVDVKFDEQIKQAEAKLGAIQNGRKAAAETAIAEAKVLLSESDYQAALTKIVEVAELTKEEPPTDELPNSELQPANSELQTPDPTLPADAPSAEAAGSGSR